MIPPLRKRVSLWHLLLLSFAGYALLAVLFPLIPHYRQVPLVDVRSFLPSLTGGLAYAALFSGQYGLYALIYQRVARRPLPLRTILLITVLFAAPLLLTYPINATDVFRYFVRARVTIVHGESPLAVPPSAFPEDPYLPLAGSWATETSPYGPVWELVAGGIAMLSSQNLLLALLLFKGMGLLSHLGSAALIWHSQENGARAGRAARTVLWAWNPAVLYMFVADGHNDALMILWLLLGFWLVERRKRPVAGVVALALAPLTKPIGLLPIPFFLLSAWRRLPDAGRRWRFLLAAGTGSLALAALAFLPFGSPIDVASRLLREVAISGGFSPATLFWFFSHRVGSGISGPRLGGIGVLLFTLLALSLLWRGWRGRSALRGAADVFLSYLVTSITFRIWYTIWAFPWLLLDRNGRWRLAFGLSFLFTAQLSVVIYGHVRVHLLDESMFQAHLLGVPFTFGLPLVLALVVRDRLRLDTLRR